MPCHGWDSQNINKYNAWICKLCKTTSDDQPWLFNTRNLQQTGDDRTQPDLEGRRRTEHFEGLPKYGSWVLTRTMACGPSRCGHWLCKLHHAIGRRIGSRRNLGSLPYLPFQRPEDMRFFMQDFGSNFLPTWKTSLPINVNTNQNTIHQYITDLSVVSLGEFISLHGVGGFNGWIGLVQSNNVKIVIPSTLPYWLENFHFDHHVFTPFSSQKSIAPGSIFLTFLTDQRDLNLCFIVSQRHCCRCSLGLLFFFTDKRI